MIVGINGPEPEVALTGAEDAVIVLQDGNCLHEHAGFFFERVIAFERDLHALSADLPDGRYSYEPDRHLHSPSRNA